ncbi:hypothetical protein JCM33374_g5693 [Metschnikowia sp. JCM 33374]|nr:hypothetical protein JCM33374_g5693 [Metschnikowia sp. JCM 33374]
MSTTSREASPVQSDHASPRLKPPPQRRGDSDSNSTNQRKKSPPIYVREIPSRSPSQKPEELIDPFLAQYIKPTSSLNHELYFKSLKKQVRIRSFDYYEKYLNHNKDKSPRVNILKQDAIYSKKPLSPLRREISPTIPQASDRKLDIDKEVPQRRRKLGNDSNVEPESKKSQPQVIAEILPIQFEECPSSDLINLMARMIQSLISLNDRSVPASISSPPSLKSPAMGPEQKNKLLTRYHSRTPPAISIHTYISRLTKFNNLTPATLLTTIYYIDLLSHNFQPYFTLNSWTVHRFLLVATMLAQKSLEDFFFTNDHYARVGGVALTELNFLELDFLNRVDWKVVPAKQISPTQTSIRHSKEVLDLYYWQLVNLMGKNITEKDKITYLLAQRSS